MLAEKIAWIKRSGIVIDPNKEKIFSNPNALKIMEEEYYKTYGKSRAEFGLRWRAIFLGVFAAFFANDYVKNEKIEDRKFSYLCKSMRESQKKLNYVWSSFLTMEKEINSITEIDNLAISKIAKYMQKFKNEITQLKSIKEDFELMQCEADKKTFNTSTLTRKWGYGNKSKVEATMDSCSDLISRFESRCDYMCYVRSLVSKLHKIALIDILDMMIKEIKIDSIEAIIEVLSKNPESEFAKEYIDLITFIYHIHPFENEIYDVHTKKLVKVNNEIEFNKIRYEIISDFDRNSRIENDINNHSLSLIINIGYAYLKLAELEQDVKFKENYLIKTQKFISESIKLSKGQSFMPHYVNSHLKFVLGKNEESEREFEIAKIINERIKTPHWLEKMEKPPSFTTSSKADDSMDSVRKEDGTG
ncbi:MAG: hypothetical protein K2X39_01870 [Silvanigrellaceae bacterium]|nr:hypothetical protein [Silvanigrellaceae bacterium]